MKKALITVALGVALIGGAHWLYTGTGPIPTWFQDKNDSVFKWDAEKIRKNPELWYKSARKETAQIRQDLSTSRFSTTIKRNVWENNAANAKAKVKGFTAFLDKAKADFAKAEASESWPVSVNGRQFGQKKLQSAIVKAHRDRERNSKRLRTYGNMVNKADTMIQKISDKLDNLVDLDRDLELGLEMAKASKHLVDLTGLSNRASEIRATAAALQQELEALFDEDIDYDASHADEASFNTIMNEGTDASAAATPSGNLD